MTDQEIAQTAAKRWGRKDPCPADVINEHIPNYGQEPIQRRRWHRIAQMAYSIAAPNHCEHCGRAMHGKGTRRYCDARCYQESFVEREARRSP